ncbi:MAG: hypothetical protein LBK99_26000 [Opitutaceae bacterium]|nr:hypothetical protein [Opitutaceae bacterium]
MKRILTLCFPLFIVLAGSSSVQAGLLVYEGFDGYTPGTGLEGSTPNENTVGLDTTRVYVDGAATERYTDTVLADGLTFGSLGTSGGALGFSNTGETSNGVNVLGAYLSSDVSGYTGTLWNSYLVNLTIQGTGATAGMGIRIGASPSESTSRFNSWGDSRNGSNNTRVAVTYGSGTTGKDGTAGLELNTTYIIISRFTNAGLDLGVSVSGTATLWALTETQFADFLAAGGNETALANVSVTAMVTENPVTSGKQTFTGAISFVSANDAGTIDELRWGSSLESVTPVVPVPEPATVALVLGMGAGLLGMACRLRHQA